MPDIQLKKIKIKFFIFSFFCFFICGCSEKYNRSAKNSQKQSSYGASFLAEESCCTDDSYCQDGLWCNGRELCDCWGECIEGSPPDCNDGDECTVDSCNEVLDRCEHVQITGCCHNSSDCDDSNPCTNDLCSNGACNHIALSDGTPCGSSPNQCYRLVCRSGSCVSIVDTGNSCTYDIAGPCFNPGVCRSDGLCQPVLHPPSNDTCSGAQSVVLNPSGRGSAAGSTLCAINDYSGTCGGSGNPDVVYTVSYTVSPEEFQLYSYNVVVNADYNSILYARTTCTNSATEVVCNNDCVSNPILNCGLYGLNPTDSGITLGPKPAGSVQNYSLIVDGTGGTGGTFILIVDRVAHSNNPCSSWRDNVRVVDATSGGEFRGNINGYVNDLMDAGLNWVKTSCHSGAESASFDWPARAWFKLSPPVARRYRIRTFENTPVNWFDTVIEVWDNTVIRGCDGIKTYTGNCAHINNRNNGTQLEINVPAGSTYLIGISSFTRPVGGDYVVEFRIL